MKIGIYDPYLDTLAGGEKYMLTMAMCLAERHNVAIFWDTDKEQEIRKKIKEKFGFDLSTISFAQNIFDQKTSFVTRFRVSSHYDYIILLSDGSIPYLASKIILHFQSPMEWVRTNPVKLKIKLRKVKHIICNSEFTKKYIDKTFRISSKVLYPPVEIRPPVEDVKENIILNVGRFGINHAGSSFKKQDVMISSFKKMIGQGVKGWKFIVVVSTMNREEKEKLEDLKKATSNFPIEIVENPTNETLWKLYAKAKIYWHAAGYGEDLEKHPDRAEHFGMATVEAMGMGAVPVVIHAGGQKEIVTEGESGYLWESTDELISKTNALLSDSVLLQWLGKGAKERANKFNKNIFCDQLVKLIQ